MEDDSKPQALSCAAVGSSLTKASYNGSISGAVPAGKCREIRARGQLRQRALEPASRSCVHRQTGAGAAGHHGHLPFGAVRRATFRRRVVEPVKDETPAFPVDGDAGERLGVEAQEAVFAHVGADLAPGLQRLVRNGEDDRVVVELGVAARRLFLRIEVADEERLAPVVAVEREAQLGRDESGLV